MRIDTQALFRGRLAKIIVMTNDVKSVYLKGWNYLTKDIVDIDYTVKSGNGFSKIEFIAPELNGCVFGRINGKSIIKKLGDVSNILMLHYKKGYDVPYTLYEVFNNNLKTKDGKAKNIVDEFFYIPYTKDDIFIKIFKNYIILNKQKFITDYDIIMDGDIKLNSTFNAIIGDVKIGDIQLGDYQIKDVKLDVEIPNIEIKDY